MAAAKPGTKKAKDASSKLTLDNLSEHINSGTDNSGVRRLPIGGGMSAMLGMSTGSGQAMTSKVLKGFGDILEDLAAELKANDMESKLMYFPSDATDSSSNMGFDTIALCLASGDQVHVYPWIVSASRDIGDFGSTVMNNGMETFTVNRVPSEAYDKTFVKIITSKVGPVYNSSAVVVKPPRVLYENFDASDEDKLLGEFGKGFELILFSLNEALDKVVDMTVADITANKKTSLNILLSAPPTDALTLDENGIPIGATLIANVSIATAQKNKHMSTMNSGSANIHVARISARAGAVYAPPAGHVQASAYMPQQNTLARPFSAQIIISDIDMATPAPSKFALCLMAATVFIDPNVVRRLIIPESIGVLNVEANIKNTSKPKAISKEDSVANYNAIFPAIFNDNVVVSFLIKPGSTLFSLNRKYLGYNDAEAKLEIINGLNTFTNGAFGNAFPADAQIVQNIEKYPVGTYTDKAGNLRPIDEIDLLYIMNALPTQAKVHAEWVLASSGTMDPNQAYAKKIEIINLVTSNRANFTDSQFLVNLSPQVASALFKCLTSTNLPVQSNVTAFVNHSQTGWNAYMSATQGVDMPQFMAMSPSTFAHAFGQTQKGADYSPFWK